MTDNLSDDAWVVLDSAIKLRARVLREFRLSRPTLIDDLDKAIAFFRSAFDFIEEQNQ